MDFVSNSVLTCLASVFTSKDILMTMGNVERREWLTLIVNIRGLTDIDAFGDTTLHSDGAVWCGLSCNPQEKIGAVVLKMEFCQGIASMGLRTSHRLFSLVSKMVVL